MDSILTIDGVDYDADARADARFDALDSLTVNLDGPPDTLAWTLVGVGPVPPFDCGMPVEWTADGALRFVGDVATIAHRQTHDGWAVAFTATGLKARADRVTITGQDGSGLARFNLAPGDDYYIPADAGQTVGDMVRRVLTIPANAAALAALGIGAYTTLTPPTLPAGTLTDLAALDVVPPHPVVLSGESILNEIEGLVGHWHPRFSLWVRPDGVIRCRDLFTMPPVALVIPGEATGVTPDPVGWPVATRDTSGCFTAVEVRGRDIRPAILDLLEGTLVAAVAPGSLTPPWTLSDFLQPKDAVDIGALSSLTPSTCTVDPDDATHFWSSGFWNASNRQGWIFFYYPAGAGIVIHDARKITTTGALAAGGTGTIGWDAGDPLDSLAYTRYKIVGTAGPRVDVGRLYTVREPTGPLLGVNTWVGSHMAPRFPQPVPWRSGGVGVMTTTPVGVIQWSQSGSAPFLEIPFTFDLVPETGQIRAAYPLAQLTASADVLNRGYPTAAADGAPVNVRVMIPYDRGGAVARVPTTSYEGTGFTEDAIERVLTIHCDSWTYAGDKSNMLKLAREHLDTVKDSVIEGSLLHHGWPAGWDPLDMGYCLNLSVAGSASPWDGLDLPVRSVTLRWPQASGEEHEIIFGFSNRKRPFQGDDLYIHPIDGGGAAPFGGQLPFGQSDFMQIQIMEGDGTAPPLDTTQGILTPDPSIMLPLGDQVDTSGLDFDASQPAPRRDRSIGKARGGPGRSQTEEVNRFEVLRDQAGPVEGGHGPVVPHDEAAAALGAEAAPGMPDIGSTTKASTQGKGQEDFMIPEGERADRNDAFARTIPTGIVDDEEEIP